MLMAIFSFPCNPYQANTYLFSDPSGCCVLIDATFHNMKEWSEISTLLEKNNLRLISLIITHYHFDHVIGINLFRSMFDLPILAHRGGMGFINQVAAQAGIFGVKIESDFSPTEWLSGGDIISVGQSELKVLYTPGHADGSICLYCEKEGVVFAGDVLFRESIGRTDLPTGDFQTLAESIQKELFALPEHTTVFPGHGPTTSIGHEKRFNPFL
ncbi:MAG: MBL fold hydrolase [Bacteroidetes bacterium HGW-Bacteroidetes-22]|nr:MAG: MBL fold hydrolase [Bacteroidetes bacterium HGW-Bacteroidetes-22]